MHKSPNSCRNQNLQFWWAKTEKRPKKRHLNPSQITVLIRIHFVLCVPIFFALLCLIKIETDENITWSSAVEYGKIIVFYIMKTRDREKKKVWINYYKRHQQPIQSNWTKKKRQIDAAAARAYCFSNYVFFFSLSRALSSISRAYYKVIGITRY